MTHPIGFEIPDSRYPTLFVGGRVTKFPPHVPELGGKVVKYEFGAGCPWVVEWDREVSFRVSVWGPGISQSSRIHVHLGEELRHEHVCIVCEHNRHRVDHTHECVCGVEWRNVTK
jgi:hypothetical protein